jgi:hypothetical protein
MILAININMTVKIEEEQTYNTNKNPLIIAINNVRTFLGLKTY